MNEQAFKLQIVNGLQGDPAVFLLIKSIGEALLFDLGSLETLSHRELLKIRHVFVSHTHMDHFIGFDRLLRVNVPHKRLIRIWGPAPFIIRVQAKLRAYTWNLIEADQVRFHVSEIHADGRIDEALLSNSDDFAINLQDKQPQQQSMKRLCQFADGSHMEAARLDHKGTPSIAYRLEAPPRYRVNASRMSELRLVPGAWLSELQFKLRQGQIEDELEVMGHVWRVGDLGQELIQMEEGPSLAYLTDFSFDTHNLKALRQDFGLCRHVISECSFLDVDVQRAVDKAHLTTRHSALMAVMLGASYLHSFHISSIYGQQSETVAEEAKQIFAGLTGATPEQLEQQLQIELRRTERLALN